MSMNNRDFRNYKNYQIKLFKEILKTHKKKQFDEQALPSYTNPNPLMRYLFWERIRIVINYISSFHNISTCLDFGCGLGTMVPYLIHNTQSLIVLDLDTSLLQEIGEKEGWQEIIYVNRLDQLNKFKGKIDLILALDVLEHVDNLPDVLDLFSQLLSDEGNLVITGPTENFIYKLGRKLANYSGDYHIRNIYDVKTESEKYFRIVSQKTLFRMIPFFKIYIIKKNRNF